MKVAHLALVASYADQRTRLEHPVTDYADALKWWSLLAPFTDPAAVWTMEQVA